jgi:hypothetical protein
MALRRCLLLAVMAAGCFLASSPLQAQPASLSTEVVMSSSSLSNGQQAQVDRYVTGWVDQLLSNDPEHIANGRRHLIDPFSLPGVTPLFITAYSPAISRELISRKALANESALVRINAMIVASRLTDAGVVLLIRQGLEDKTPAVRYWAAEAAANAGQHLNPADQKEVLQALNNSWEKENAIDVLEKILVAMDALNTPEASLQLLAVLNHRVDVHAANPALPVTAELEGLEGVTVRTFSALTAPGSTVNKPLLKQLVIVLFRYLDLATGMLEHPQAKLPDPNDLHRVMLIAGNYLPRLAPRLEPTARLGSLTGRSTSPNDPAANRVLVEEWRRVLTSPPFNFNAAELAVKTLASVTQPAVNATEPATEPEQEP